MARNTQLVTRIDTEALPELAGLEPVTLQQQRFCERYATHLNRNLAVQEAGYSERNNGSWGQIADRLLAVPKVRAWVKAMLAAYSRMSVEVDGPRIRAELQGMAMADVGTFFEKDPTPLRDEAGEIIRDKRRRPVWNGKFRVRDFTKMDTRGIKAIKIVDNNHGQQVHLEAFNKQEALVRLGKAKGEFLEEEPRPPELHLHFNMPMPVKVAQVIDVTALSDASVVPKGGEE